MEIFKAHRQWASRPADERFQSVQALYDATKAYADVAHEKVVPYHLLRAQAVGDDVQLVGKANVPVALTHWAFGQLCAKVEAPASYLRNLPAALAAQNINHGLGLASNCAPNDEVQLLFHSNEEGLLLRAITSNKYARIWNYEVAERLLGLQGWKPATPDKIWDASQEGVTALYASDHDMFAFLKSDKTIVESGASEPLFRGMIVENSEVGASTLHMTGFLYRRMCGNHIISGASKVRELALRHVGSIRERFSTFQLELRRYLESSASDDEARIASAKSRFIAGTKEEVLDKLFGVRSLGLSRKALEASYDAVQPDDDGDPKTMWGFVQGATRYSQTVPYADQRMALDKAAGKVLDLVF